VLGHAGVARRGDEADVPFRRLREHFVLLGQEGSGRARLRLAEAHRDHIAEVVLRGVLDRLEKIGVLLALGQDELQRRPRRDHMRPLDVDRDLPGPADLQPARGVERRQAVRRDRLRNGRGRQSPDLVERGHVGLQHGVLEGVDDDDGPALAGDAAVVESLHVVRGLDLGRSVAREWEAGLLALERRRGQRVGPGVRPRVVLDHRLAGWGHRVGRGRHRTCQQKARRGQQTCSKARDDTETREPKPQTFLSLHPAHPSGLDDSGTW
jgi:hypothetical protein